MPCSKVLRLKPSAWLLLEIFLHKEYHNASNLYSSLFFCWFSCVSFGERLQQDSKLRYFFLFPCPLTFSIFYPSSLCSFLFPLFSPLFFLIFHSNQTIFNSVLGALPYVTGSRNGMEKGLPTQEWRKLVLYSFPFCDPGIKKPFCLYPTPR